MIPGLLKLQAWDTGLRQAITRRDFPLRLDCETDEDKWEIEALLDTAFGPGRKGLSAYRLREGVDPVAGLSLVSRDRFGAISGTIRFWPVRVGDLDSAALLLGPIAVHPTRQGEGIGAWLIFEGLTRARNLGWRHAILVGDLAYYSRFGFMRCPALGFPPPTDPARVLCLKLNGNGDDSLSGPVSKWGIVSVTG